MAIGFNYGGYTCHTPNVTEAGIDARTIYAGQELEDAPDGVYEWGNNTNKDILGPRQNVYGIRRVIAKQVATASNTYEYDIAGIAGGEGRSIQVTGDGIDGPLDVTVEFSVNGRDFTALPTATTATIAATPNRNTHIFSISNLPCLLFRVTVDASAATTGYIEVHSC